LETKRAEQVLPESSGEGKKEGRRDGGGVKGQGVVQTMYTHMNKCKNNLKI
jgi:hypothetical protein